MNTDTKTLKTLGQIAYEAYCEKTGWKTLFGGHSLPPWLEVKPEVQVAWNASGEAVAFRNVATLRSERPKLVCICGSSKFVEQSAVKAWELNKQGIATFYMPLLPHWYPGVQPHHQAEAEGVADKLDALWLEMIALADEVFVVNVGGYIGARTRIEIGHAMKLGKLVNFLEPLGVDMGDLKAELRKSGDAQQ